MPLTLPVVLPMRRSRPMPFQWLPSPPFPEKASSILVSGAPSVRVSKNASGTAIFDADKFKDGFVAHFLLHLAQLFCLAARSLLGFSLGFSSGAFLTTTEVFFTFGVFDLSFLSLSFSLSLSSFSGLGSGNFGFGFEII